MTIDDSPTVTRESYQELPNKNKLDILYDYNVATHKAIEELKNEITHLKKTKMRNTMYASICGFVGGAVAVLSLRVGEFFK